MVDVGVAYAGMGHVRVLSYDPWTEDDVFETLDGGANGYDREANFLSRCRMDVSSVMPRWTMRDWLRGSS